MRRVTIRDVAAEAGVSIGTASKALNGQGKLRTETRERVAEVAQRLGFAPNTLAQALLAGRSFTVGLITTDSFGRFSIPVMLGAEDALGNGQVSVFMCDTRDDPEREQRYIEMLAARRVDGLIVTGRRIEPRRAVTAGPGIPVVYAMTQPLGQDGPAVLPDDEGGGRAAAGHLLGAGRRRIGHITGPERFLAARKRDGRGSRAALAGGRAAAARRRAVRRVERAAGAGKRLASCSSRPAGHRRDLLRQRPDRPRRGRHAPRGRTEHPGRRRPGRLRQLGADGARRPALAEQRRHAPGGGRPGRRRTAAGRYRRASPRAARGPCPAAWWYASPAGDPVAPAGALPSSGRTRRIVRLSQETVPSIYIDLDSLPM